MFSSSSCKLPPQWGDRKSLSYNFLPQWHSAHLFQMRSPPSPFKHPFPLRAFLPLSKGVKGLALMFKHSLQTSIHYSQLDIERDMKVGGNITALIAGAFSAAMIKFLASEEPALMLIDSPCQVAWLRRAWVSLTCAQVKMVVNRALKWGQNPTKGRYITPLHPHGTPLPILFYLHTISLLDNRSLDLRSNLLMYQLTCAQVKLVPNRAMEWGPRGNILPLFTPHPTPILLNMYFIAWKEGLALELNPHPHFTLPQHTLFTAWVGLLTSEIHLHLWICWFKVKVMKWKSINSLPADFFLFERVWTLNL